MKIVFHINGIDGGGVAMWTKLLCQGLLQRGHELFFIANQDGALAQEAKAWGQIYCLNIPWQSPKTVNLGVCRFPHPNPLIMNRNLAKNYIDSVYERLRFWGGDVLIGNGPGSLLTEYSSNETGIPIVLVAHNVGSFHNDLFSFKTRWGARQLNRADRVVAVGQTIVNRYKRFLTKPCDLIANACAPLFAPQLKETVLRRLNIPSTALIVGSIGRVTHDKGYHVILDAFLRLAGSYPQIHCILAGSVGSVEDEQYLEALVDKACKAGFANRVHFPGVMAPRDFYSCVDIFCLGRLSIEPFGIVVIESLSAGVPVLAPNIGGPAEILQGSSAGILIPAGSVQEYALAMEDLVNHPVKRAKMGEEGRRLHRCEYSLDSWIDSWEQCLTNAGRAH